MGRYVKVLSRTCWATAHAACAANRRSVMKLSEFKAKAMHSMATLEFINHLYLQANEAAIFEDRRYES
jgi:hypothetical protein